MSEEPDSLILQHLRAIRSDIAGLRETTSDLVGRMGRVEQGLAQLRRESADVHVILAEHPVKRDRLSERLDRIDRRLGLIEA